MGTTTSARTRSGRLALTIGTSLLLAGIAAPAAAADPSPAVPLDPNAIVIEVGYEGGYVMPGTDLTRFPLVAVTADGSVYSLGAQIEIWPSPLLPPVFVSHITPERVAALLAQAAEAGLLPAEDVVYPAIDIADAPDLAFRIAGPDGVRRTGFGAWGLDQPSLGDAEIAARAAAQSFLDAVLAASMEDPAPVPFQPTAAVIVSVPYFSDADPENPQEPVEWPLSVSLATGGTPLFAEDPAGGRCIVIEGADVATAWPLFEAANILTPFTSEAGDRQLTVRPLIPGEASPCP